MNPDIELARVSCESERQSTLFPLASYSRPEYRPKELCHKIGLNWYAAGKLFEEGWLSYDPTSIQSLNVQQESELNFVGRLIVAGCDSAMLRRLLSGLRKPYAYRIDRLYYNWEKGEWRLLPMGNPEQESFEAWLDQLVDAGHLHILESVRKSVEQSITELKNVPLW